MGGFNQQNNLAMISPRMTADEFSPFLSDTIISNKTATRYDQSYFFPIYAHPDETSLDQSIRVNFDLKLYTQIRAAAGLSDPAPAPDADMVQSGAFRALTGDARPEEVQVFDYIYAVLHCPQYREIYAEFLKIDFPRVPFPTSAEAFRDLSEKGEALRRLHLMESAAIGKTPYRFDGTPLDADLNCTVEKPRFEGGKVYINGKGDKGQYFEGVPAAAWEFYIGGYQPAQKWLKDRKGRTLSFDDIQHYQKIIKILSETGRIMATIEMDLDAGASE
jgi:predicted helicase